MSSDVVFAAVQEYLTTNFSAVPLTYENDLFDPPSPNAANPIWIYVEVYGVTYNQASMGSGTPQTDLFREEGAVLFHIMSPINTGSLKARQIGTVLVSLFKGLRIEPDIRFGDLSIGEGTVQLEQGNWWPMTCRVLWARG